MEEIRFFIELLGVIIAFIGFGVWFAADSYTISRFEGKIKRGIKVWSRELPYESKQFLSDLTNDVVEHQKILFSEYKSAFIRVQNGEVLVYSTPRKFHSSWPYVGYIDLNTPGSELEYRASLPGIIFLIPFTLIGLFVFVINFIFQTKAIDSFLERKTKENISTVSRFN